MAAATASSSLVGDHVNRGMMDELESLHSVTSSRRRVESVLGFRGVRTGGLFRKSFTKISTTRQTGPIPKGVANDPAVASTSR